MTSALGPNMSNAAKEIYQKYLKYHQGEAFLFGKKGNCISLHKNSFQKGFDDKKFVWVAVAKDEYTPAEIISESGGKLTVRTQKGDEITVEKEKAEFVNPPKFDGVEDCAELSYLSEAAVLHNLRKRYEADIIYVTFHAKF